MPLYEYFCIAPGFLTNSEIAHVMRTCALRVLDRGGIVHRLDHHGIDRLPTRIKSGAEYCYYGRYWSMHFMANSQVAQEIMQCHQIHSRDVLRHAVLRKANTLATVTRTVLQPSL